MQNRTKYRMVFIALGVLGFLLWGYFFFKDINGIQRNVFFGNQDNWFMDFYNVVFYSVDRTPYTWGNMAEKNYLPFAFMILYPFSLLYPYDIVDNTDSTYYARYSQLSGIAVGVYLVISFGILFYSLYKSIKGKEIEKLTVLLVFFCSYITLFNFDRANEVILTAGLLFIFLRTYQSNNKVYRHIGYWCLACAAALKIFPAIFGILLLKEKRYKDAILTMIYGLITVFLPFLWVRGNVIENFKLLLVSLTSYADAYGTGSLGLNSMTIFKTPISWTALPYVVLVLALIAVWVSKEEWEKTMILAFVIIMTPGRQSYYCLIFLFYSMVLFFNKNHNKFDFIYLIAFTFILTPFQYYYENTIFTITNRQVTNTICILLYIGLILKQFIVAWRDSKKKNVSEQQKELA